MRDVIETRRGREAGAFRGVRAIEIRESGFRSCAKYR